jgi:hypothetical protein
MGYQISLEIVRLKSVPFMTNLLRSAAALMDNMKRSKSLRKNLQNLSKIAYF